MALLPNYDPGVVLSRDDLPINPPKIIPYLVGGIHPATLTLSRSHGGASYFAYQLRYERWDDFPDKVKRALADQSLVQANMFYTDCRPDAMPSYGGHDYAFEACNISFLVNHTLKRARAAEDLRMQLNNG